MKRKYVVLNNKLLPVNVADLLINEGAGSAPVSVQVIVKLEDAPDFIHLENLLLQAEQAGITHSYTILSITDMLLKVIKNNSKKTEKIAVKILQGNETFLHIYFLE